MPRSAGQPDATLLMNAAADGDATAAEQLLPLVYDQLRRAAQQRMAAERDDHTLSATALIHEVYLKLVGPRQIPWAGRGHFYAAAAQAMRRILIDHARGRNREKRGGGWRRVTLHDAYALTRDREVEVIALHDALEKMRGIEERAATVSEQRIFGGVTNEEAARMLDVSERTVERDWKWAQAWLRRELLGTEEGDGE